MRPGLLMTAVASITVPGLLAMAGVVGHDHVVGEGGVASAAFDRAPVTVLSRVTVGQQASAMRLLGMAADADQTTSYQGTELISQSDVGGHVEMVSQVWHTGGGQTLVQTSDSASQAASPAAASSAPEGVFGITKSLVALLGKHYVAVYRGMGAAGGRPATVVGLYRANGSLAALYWLDRKMTVPLRRQLFDTSENVISDDSFTRIQFGAVAAPPFAGAAQPQSPPAAAQAAWVAAASPARFLASLSARGWLLPAILPGGLPLYAAASTEMASGEVVDLEYSDGLYVVSLFVQRGTLAPDMPGWQPARVAGQQAYVAGHSVTWAANGLVYTMIADTSPQTVNEIVGMLAPGGSHGLLGRLLRGFDRLSRLINPFR